MDVCLIYNGRVVGKYALEPFVRGDGTYDHTQKALVPLQPYAEVAGASVHWDGELHQAMVSYCGQNMVVSVPGDGVALRDGRVWIELGTLAELLKVNWSFAEGGKVLIMGRTEAALEDHRLVVDPGHGGGDPGAVGVDDLVEKDLNLTVGRVLSQMLQLAGARVKATRMGDDQLLLSQRVATAKSFSLDAFISVHHNSYQLPKVSGTEVYYYENWNSRQLAAYVLNHLVEELGTNNRGVKEAGFYVLRQMEVPAVLVEVGFVSSPYDAAVLKHLVNQYRAAAAIFRGIRQFFEEKHVRLP